LQNYYHYFFSLSYASKETLITEKRTSWLDTSTLTGELSVEVITLKRLLNGTTKPQKQSIEIP